MYNLVVYDALLQLTSSCLTDITLSTASRDSSELNVPGVTMATSSPGVPMATSSSSESVTDVTDRSVAVVVTKKPHSDWL